MKFYLILILVIFAIIGILALLGPKILNSHNVHETETSKPQAQSNSQFISADTSKPEILNADRKIADDGVHQHGQDGNRRDTERDLALNAELKPATLTFSQRFHCPLPIVI